MNTGESQMLWVGLAILALLLFFGVAGIRVAFRIDRRLRELLRIATEIEAMIGQIRLHTPTSAPQKATVRRPQVSTKPKPATASCNCQHCGREFLFYLEGFTEEKSFGRCPGCGKLTKLRLPGERKLESAKTDLVAICGTCSTRIPFSKSEEWSKTTCPVCGAETILQTAESELRR
jgi:DNA-directed RNA polymerase subunit RPC12/RpoP/HAMP domain-containing protein